MCVFRLSTNTKGFLVYNLHTNDLTTSKNVVFYENHFPLHHTTQEIETQPIPAIVSATPFQFEQYSFDTRRFTSSSVQTIYVILTLESRDTRRYPYGYPF